MTMPTPYVVSSANPVQVTGNITQTVSTVYNSSTTDVLYLSDTGNPAGAFPLNPGSTIQWDGGKPLYLSVLGTAVVTAYVMPNGGNLTDATAIASAIIAQGLAQDIAQEISISGAPPIDSSRVPIASFSHVTVPANQMKQISGYIDVSKYNSVRVVVSPTGPVAGTFQAPCQVLVRPVAPPGAQNGMAFSCGVLDDNGQGWGAAPFNEFWIPCKSDVITVWYNNGRGGDQDVTITVYGSYQSIWSPICYIDNGYYPPYGNVVPTVSETYGTGSGYVQWPSKGSGIMGVVLPVVARSASVHIEASGVTTAGVVSVRASDISSRYLRQLKVPTGSSIIDIDLLLPNAPVTVNFSTGVIASTMVISWVVN